MNGKKNIGTTKSQAEVRKKEETRRRGEGESKDGEDDRKRKGSGKWVRRDASDEQEDGRGRSASQVEGKRE